MTLSLDATYAGARVLVTGHTGFKGSWLSLWLTQMGAEVSGFSRDVSTEPAAFNLMRLGNTISDQRGEIADPDAVLAAVRAAAPTIIFHLAAQPIVRAGFSDPIATFQANVMGTATVLEAARKTASVRAVVVVTSDKVYSNAGSAWPFRETDGLGGHEPYGASKAAAEIVTDVYRAASFHRAAGSTNIAAIASVRAGNVIGGGDWAANRLIPDFVRALSEQRRQIIRQPRATRPWQHVLEPLGGYLMTGAALLSKMPDLPPALNFGPTEAAMPDVETVARDFLKAMGGPPDLIEIRPDPHSGEAATLRVDSSLAMRCLDWRPAWSVDQAVAETAAWYRDWIGGSADMRAVSLAQLSAYRADTNVVALRQA
ncbi:CDP-glucose 4,6-dehydratase [Pseudorhodobacter sp.]|uniref:CDP-glucose 4,6-dehydratase n=1 Tax=Pseudorhodobacter sp. TaxID=1934400 RepID=UPI002649919B|nr:CDP-glucose 4,6-dehydratase [Pseudorhodobacter sp.]MDN5785904.1 CDP-glucose 4,6-dehydratase [Pseudorhodobacter sp.]